MTEKNSADLLTAINTINDGGNNTASKVRGVLTDMIDSAPNTIDDPLNPGGADTQVQFNAGGTFGGDADFNYDQILGQLKIDSKSASDPALIVEGQGSTTPIFTAQRSGGSRKLEIGMLNSNQMFFRMQGNMAVGGTAPRDDTVFTTSLSIFNPTKQQSGANFSLTMRPTSGPNSQIVNGGVFNVSTLHANNLTGTMRGGSFSVQNNNTATLTTAEGGKFLCYNTAAGTITNSYGSRSTLQNLNVSGVVGAHYNYYADLTFNNGTVTNMFGYYCGDITKGTITNTSYSFYASDVGADNFFAGKTGFDSGNDAPSADVDIGGDHIRIRQSKTPTSASHTGNQGDIAWDNDFIYVCTAANTWKRTALVGW